jgi:ureidoglycolate lyase
MPLKIDAPYGEVLLETEALSRRTFCAFGTVIENPEPSLVPSPDLKSVPPNAVQANQGSALKYLNVTHMQNLYGLAPSQVQAKAVMNMFVCAPRLLAPSQESRTDGMFPVEILERHPYTTQTFIPLGLSPSQAHRARYIVIVAPSLPPSSADQDLPVPVPASGSEHLPGRGLPDLRKLKAFIANGSQAVTYGPGTWHAPMVAIGKDPISFVVVQFANGVDNEDCQEAVWEKNGIRAPIPKVPHKLSKL